MEMCWMVVGVLLQVEGCMCRDGGMKSNGMLSYISSWWKCMPSVGGR